MNRDVLVALASGVLFGLGLAISQMVNPAKVLAFLDVAGAWDPSLALVMAAALLVMGIAWRLQGRPLFAGFARSAGAGGFARRQTAAGGPAARGSRAADLDSSLVTGAVLFGIGWGLVGYCPGPAIASLGLFDFKPLVFVLAMLAGMVVHRGWLQRQAWRRIDQTSA